MPLGDWTTDAEQLAVGGENVAVTAVVASGEKCDRCWHRAETVGKNAEHAPLCERCISNAFGDGEQRRFA